MIARKVLQDIGGKFNDVRKDYCREIQGTARET